MEKVTDLRYKRTLFIGLGGAGAKTLRRLKKKILETNDGILPKQVKFLLIDTNATELANYRDFDSSEKFCIAVREPYLRYKHDLDDKSSTHAFIPLNNVHSLLALERGAGQIRSNGHFAVIENQYSNKLIRIFREKADDIECIDIDNNKLEKDPKIEVRLVFSLAGGTGSGTFLPIATLLRSAIKHCELTAYIYSATHYERFVENSAKYSVMQNAYAALCELDYMMHIGMSGYDQVQFNFGPHENQHITATHRPFEEVYYIDKRTGLPTSDSVEFAYNEIKRLQDNTSDIMHLAATNIITAHQGTIDNVRQKIQEGQFNVGDKYAWISGVGISKLFLNKEAKDSLVVIDAAVKAIEARIKDTEEIDVKAAGEIANKFNEDGIRFDERKGDDDGDPILRYFVERTRIKNACEDLIYKKYNKKNAPSLRSGDFEIDLDSIIESSTKSDAKSSELLQNFKVRVDNMIARLFDDAEYKNVKLNNVSVGGVSFQFIIEVLHKINDILKLSENQLDEELKDWEGKEAEMNDKIEDLNSPEQSSPTANPNNGKGLISRLITPIMGNNNPPANNVTTGTDNLEDKVKPVQVEAIYFRMLKERTEKAKEIFVKSQIIVNERIECLEKISEILSHAFDWGDSLLPKDKKNDTEALKQVEENRMPQSNIVEVKAIDLEKGYLLTSDNLKTLWTCYKESKLPNPQAKFTKIQEFIESTSKELDDYLIAGLEGIEELAEDKHIRVERTECQKKIDRLIDLSMPTMQVDYHGYGDRVQVDHFWYIMTECPEENEGEKPTNTKKSVGALLKSLIEQNTLDAKINLVHVPGWNNQALIFRVDSAVPAYFVEGVCIGEGGHTLEGCYEELKKTNRTYTPFSHKYLQEKLENGICVLKPHDDVSESEALEHWINFNLLGLIQFESTKGTIGTYKIASEKLGKVLSIGLTDLSKVLVLGDTREHAFNSFSRYCKTLVEENLIVSDPEGFTYLEAINPLEYSEQEEYVNKFIMSGDKYLDVIFQEDDVLKWHGKPITWAEYNKHLDENNPEYKQLKKEVDFMENRKKNHNS